MSGAAERSCTRRNLSRRRTTLRIAPSRWPALLGSGARARPVVGLHRGPHRHANAAPGSDPGPRRVPAVRDHHPRLLRGRVPASGGGGRTGCPASRRGRRTCSSGSLLALMAFLLAITMGMASDRFDARRGTRAGGGERDRHAATCRPATCRRPRPTDAELLREYLPLRIATDDRRAVAGEHQRSRRAARGACGRSRKRSSRPGTTRTSCRPSATR